MDDPVLRALETAPLDDEPVTPEEEADMEEAYADIAAGRTITTAEMRRRLAIVAEPHRPGDARLAKGPHVWAVIGYLRANGSDMARTAADYGLTPKDVEAALDYYWRHQTIIDGILAEQVAFHATP